MSSPSAASMRSPRRDSACSQRGMDGRRPGPCGGETRVSSEHSFSVRAGPFGPRGDHPERHGSSSPAASLSHDAAAASLFTRTGTYMLTRQWLIAIPLAILLVGSTARGSAVRDEGEDVQPSGRRGGPAPPRAAGTKDAYSRGDRDHRSHPRISKERPRQRSGKRINRLAVRRDQKIHDRGMYILLSKRDRLISEPLIREHLKNIVTLEKRHAIRQAFHRRIQARRTSMAGWREGVSRDRADPGRRECRQSSGRARAGRARTGRTGAPAVQLAEAVA